MSQDPVVEKKVTRLLDRLIEVEQTLGQPEVFDDQKAYRELTQEHAYLNDVKAAWDDLTVVQNQLSDNKEMVQLENDEEFAAVLREDIQDLEKRLPALDQRLQNLLVPPDPNDHRNTILELRAGTGGDEASLFVGDCMRMYSLFADKMGWKIELLSASPGEVGGFKEVIVVVSGQNAYRYLRYEAGTHRVQRVPETETQGRIHTSAITVAALTEPDEDEEIDLDPQELRIDTQRASGAGGQHVNVTDSAVRITHLPTGTMVYCQQEKSQHKNKAHAMRVLKAKIADVERQKKMKELADTRAQQVGSGDRSERIRTYNFPQNRLTDHRINLTLYNLDKVMEGEVEEISIALVSHYRQKQLDEDS